MMTFHLLEAKDWIIEGKPVMYVEDEKKFVTGDWKERVRRLFCSKDQKIQIQKIVEIVQKQLILKNLATDQAAQELWTACITKYGDKKFLKKFIRTVERTLCQQRVDLPFQETSNRSEFKKWVEKGFCEVVYRQFPLFSQFLLDSDLLSQINKAHDAFKMLDDEPFLLVEGEWMKWDDLLENFTFKLSNHYNEVFILRKADNEVFTYLDNGKGLQLHHPYLSKKLTPATIINEHQLRAIQEKAAKFKREERDAHQECSFVLQIVSSYVRGPQTNFHEFFVKRNHPYLRIVIGKDDSDLGIRKGEVYETGYGWKQKSLISCSFNAGRLRSSGLWKEMSCEDRVVTHIPLLQEEVHNILAFTQQYHNESINLGKDNLGRRNSSEYVKEAVKRAGIRIPTEVKVTHFLRKICPEWIKEIGRGIVFAAQTIKKVFSKRFPIVKRGVCERIKAVISCFLSEKIRGFEDKNGDENLAIKGWRSCFVIPKINLDGVLQEWQREQLSTEIFSSSS